MGEFIINSRKNEQVVASLPIGKINDLDRRVGVLEANPGSGSPGGNDTEIQFNDGGLFGGDPHFTFDKVNDVLHVHKIAGDATDGLIIESANGTDIGLLGPANTANVTWYGQHNFSTDIEVTDTVKGIVLRSPDGTRWRIGITNNGELTASPL